MPPSERWVDKAVPLVPTTTYTERPKASRLQQKALPLEVLEERTEAATLSQSVRPPPAGPLVDGSHHLKPTTYRVGVSLRVRLRLVESSGKQASAL